MKDSLPTRYMCHTLAELAATTVHACDFRGKFSLIHNELSWPISIVQSKFRAGCLDPTFPGAALMSTCEKGNGGGSSLTQYNSHPKGLEGGRAGLKWEGRTCRMDAKVDFSVRSPKLLKSLCTWFAAACHSSAPTTATLFPTGLNLSKGILCMSVPPPYISKGRLVVGLNCCSETLLMLTPLY